MSDIFKKALQLLVGSDDQFKNLAISEKELKNRPFKSLTEHDLIRLESEIGSELFGPIPATHRRSFFNLDSTTWIWHEEWVDVDTGKKRVATTRYEIQPKGILKVQEGARYSYLEGQELANLTVAVQMYYERVAREIYNRDPATGKKLS